MTDDTESEPLALLREPVHSEAWAKRIAAQKLPKLLSDLSVEKYQEHPIREMIFNDIDPKTFTYNDLIRLHAEWKTKSKRKALAKAKTKARREQRKAEIYADRVWYWKKLGLTDAEARRVVQNEFPKLWGKYKEAIRRNRATAKSLAKRKELLEAVLMHWKDQGATLRGFRLPLSDSSKPVRWAAHRFEGMAGDQVNRALRRMAAKQKGWRTDFESFTAFR